MDTGTAALFRLICSFWHFSITYRADYMILQFHPSSKSAASDRFSSLPLAEPTPQPGAVGAAGGQRDVLASSRLRAFGRAIAKSLRQRLSESGLSGFKDAQDWDCYPENPKILEILIQTKTLPSSRGIWGKRGIVDSELVSYCRRKARDSMQPGRLFIGEAAGRLPGSSLRRMKSGRPRGVSIARRARTNLDSEVTRCQ